CCNAKPLPCDRCRYIITVTEKSGPRSAARLPPNEAKSAAPPDPVGEFLAALSAPLNFLAGAPVAAVARTQFPAQAFAARRQALLRQVQNAPLRKHLQALCTVLSGYTAASPPQQRADIQHCRELVERIRAMSGGPPPVYRRSAAAVAEDLIALAQSV